jgi:hypothetical protein
MSILLASMRHAQLNGKFVKKIDFFDKKFGFFNRKISVFGIKIEFFDEKTAFPHRQPQYMLKFLCRIFPTAKQGFLFLHSRMCQAPFSYGDPRVETGTHFFLILVWKRGFPISIWGCVNPRFHMGIPVWKCFWRPKFLAMRWRLVRDSMADQNYSPRFHTGNSHMEMCRLLEPSKTGTYKMYPY